MSRIRVSCPSCRGLFELDDEFRGEEVDCPKCAVPFQIPMSGDKGIPIADTEDDVDTIDMACPYCRTFFALSPSYRGELAECVECRKLFLIPQTGSYGEPVDDEDESSVENNVAETAVGTMKSSGIQPMPKGSAPNKKTATIVLSRDEVVGDLSDLGRRAPTPPRSSSDNVAAKDASKNKPRRLKPSIAIKRVSDNGEIIEDDAEMDETTSEEVDADAQAMALAALYEPPGRTVSSTPVVDISQAGIKRDTLHDIAPADIRGGDLERNLPDWVPPLDLSKSERLTYVEEGAEPPCGIHYLLSGIPVVVTPLAVIAVVALKVHPAICASIGFLIGLIFWGTYVSRFIPTLYRRVLILTTERAIMADATEVVDIDLPKKDERERKKS